jgi:ubiquitin carboxyl-terminal hydrolase 4/11/15
MRNSFICSTKCSNHYGGLGGGHYTAYALHDDGVWCYYDDARITENADEKDVVSDAAYVVYYKRRDLVFSDDLPDGLEAAIVTDQMDSRVRTPSETSSNAAQLDDMDVDIHNTDAESNASSKTCSSPMDSHDGGDNNFAETDTFGEGVDEPNDGLYYDHLRESSNTNENYPLQ